MESERNIDKPQNQDETSERKDRLERTRKLLFEEQFSDIRNLIENSQKFEREIVIQNFAERDLLSEKRFNESSDLISTLTKRIDLMEAEIKYLKQNKIDIQKLAIVLSDLSLQLMNIASNDKD